MKMKKESEPLTNEKNDFQHIEVKSQVREPGLKQSMTEKYSGAFIYRPKH